ncbi:lytic transglycosylase domain-containing protein [uncultured Tateyamaria sp.]|uniref:lytic transglycosylase domain-containing protein n=1 Tax=uncultured Tateyamaria sp. TaxID=455651 RepID=UPI0026365792|nr:lytic transglycosylase domain-containing protein [uncultured Tateyamaria sp.]
MRRWEMQVMSRCACAVMALFLLAVTALAERPRPLGWALDAMRAGNWDTAAALAARDGPIAADVIEWHRLRTGRGTYAEVRAFLGRRPDWPGQAYLLRQSEDAVAKAGDAALLRFYDDAIPQTASATLDYAAALISAGQRSKAETALILAWRTMPMSAATHALYLSLYGEVIRPHHQARATAMLWDRQRDDARRMFDLIPDDQAALGRARLALQAGSTTVNALIDALPAALQSDAGLSHDRFEWRIRKGRWDDAKDLLLATSRSADTLGRPEAWANRRRAVVRDEMRGGDASRAYQMAANHFLMFGSNYADLEWLAGYIALRKLDDPELALGHFQNHRAAITSLISRGRAGYWIGRAHEAMGSSDAAQAAYADGAQFQTSFYGLLAAERGDLPIDPLLAGTASVPDWRSSDLAERDLFQAGLLLQASDELDLAERFWTHLAETLHPTETAQLGQAAIDAEQPHLAVMIGKQVARRGITLHAPYYALHPLAEADLPMAPEMNLAIARRESEFDPKVQSSAGARGLMQLMPATAQEVAGSLGRNDEHSTARLTTDPVYNAELGSTFLSQLVPQFGGNVILMSAAYNAGPSRPIRWMGLYGDPRRLGPEFDVIDWIEHIPFRETRNYVMRVTESLPVYRARLGKDALPIPFSEELTGSTLLPFAP